MVRAAAFKAFSESTAAAFSHPHVILPRLCPSRSCAFNRVLYEAEEEDVEPREQPQLLEQRHHHGLLQQARRGAAQRDSHPGERGTEAPPLSAPRLLVGLGTAR